MSTTQGLANFIWQVADLLRRDYKQSEYGRVVLPLTVLRRLDCVLEPTKPDVLAKHAPRWRAWFDNVEPILRGGGWTVSVLQIFASSCRSSLSTSLRSVWVMSLTAKS